MRPIATTTIYIIDASADRKVIDAVTKELNAQSTTIIPDWLKETFNNPNTVDDESGMKYNRDTDVLVVLGNNYKE